MHYVICCTLIYMCNPFFFFFYESAVRQQSSLTSESLLIRVSFNFDVSIRTSGKAVIFLNFTSDVIFHRTNVFQRQLTSLARVVLIFYFFYRTLPSPMEARAFETCRQRKQLRGALTCFCQRIPEYFDKNRRPRVCFIIYTRETLKKI